MKKTPGISVVVPTIRTSVDVRDCLLSVITALNFFSDEKELLIIADRKLEVDDFLRHFTSKYPFVRVLETEGAEGSACARLKALKEVQYQIVLFTDDDCTVPTDWAVRMYKNIMSHGVVAGNLCAAQPKNIYSSVDAYIDQLRIKSRDEVGNIKYLSFPNFGIKRELLPKEPFLASSMNTTEDIDLACKLRLEGIEIYLDESLVVVTEYPITLLGLLRRKVKHAKGIALLRSNLCAKKLSHLGFTETPWQMFARWVTLSSRIRVGLVEKMYMILANAVYSIALGYYERKFKHKK